MKRAVITLLLTLTFTLAQPVSVAAAEIRVWTARALATVLVEIGAEFERTTGHKLIVSSGLPTEFAERAKAGEQFDLFISGTSPVDEWIKEGRLIASTRTNVARSGIGVEVRKGARKPDISSIEAFKRALLEAKSIGYLKIGSGIYLDRLFERLGIADAIKSKIVRPDSDIVSELVAKGEIELGVVVITQILTTPGVELVGPLPAEIQSHVMFTAGIATNSKVHKEASRLIEFLTGPKAIPVIKTQGMEPATNDRNHPINSGATSAPELPTFVWRLTWRSEFESTDRLDIERDKWTTETGGAGWGNKELQFYTDRPTNASLNGKGSLVITAVKEKLDSSKKCWYGECQYSSARLITKNKFAQKYGRIEVRAKIPVGQGIWPAIWMLGNDIDAVGWPACGEIDIMENIGSEPATVHGTIHGPGYSGKHGITGNHKLKDGKKFSDDFHIFAVEWAPEEIRWYVDGEMYQRRTPADLPRETKWVFDHPFFIILNLAVGGNWPGSPDVTTKFPQRFEVDYVRVYQRSSF